MPKQKRQKGLKQDQPDAITPPNPFAIPELIEMVGRCLDRHALTMCLRVCRQWYQILHLQIWKEVEIYSGGRRAPNRTYSYGPYLALLNQHADHVRKLFIAFDNMSILVFPGQPPIFFPWLTELQVVMEELECRPTDPFLEQRLPPFIVRHKATLKRLTLRVNMGKTLMEAMMACSNLESLTTWPPHVEESRVQDGWMDWYESQISHLRNLTLMGLNTFSPATRFAMTEAMDSLLSGASVSSLQSLEMKSHYPTLAYVEFQVLLVLKSPELKRLSWALDDSGGGVITRLALAFDRCPKGLLFGQQLESLSIHHGSFTHHLSFFLKTLQRIIDSLPALRDLELRYCRMPRQFPSYLTTLVQLRRLRIDECSREGPDIGGKHSNIALEVLCSMPNLEIFVADRVSDYDIRRDLRPWVCTGLKELTVSFYLVSRSGGEALILNRLCRLEGLEKLIVRRELSQPCDFVRDGSLLFRLKGGLDQLKTLRRLQVVAANEGLWRESEALWALKHWTQLKELDVNMDSKAKKLLGPLVMKEPVEEDTFIF